MCVRRKLVSFLLMTFLLLFRCVGAVAVYFYDKLLRRNAIGYISETDFIYSQLYAKWIQCKAGSLLAALTLQIASFSGR